MDNFKSEYKQFCTRALPLFWCIFFASSLVLTLCLFFEPRWETNDDVAMSMVAHGYGLAATSSPNLIFSSTLWGHLVRAIPEFNGVLGYSTATLATLVIVGSALAYGLYSVGIGYVSVFFTLALLLVRPILFPQFTINAGLLMVSAIVCWHIFAQSNNKPALIAGCLLAVLSYLIRNVEAVLVLFVAAPLLPWKKFLLSRSSRVALIALVLAVIASTVIDHLSYQSSEWQIFQELNSARAPYTDFGVGDLLKRRADILAKNYYSLNDIDLIKSWFFIDLNIANPEKLKAMTQSLGLIPSSEMSMGNALLGLKALYHPTLFPIVLAAFLLMVFRPSWKTLAVWGLCIVAILILGIAGRPSVIRVYVPLVCLLLITPLIVKKPQLNSSCVKVFDWPQRFIVGSIILAAALPSAFATAKESLHSKAMSAQTLHELTNFPREPVVVWGSSFPFEAAFPVLYPPIPISIYGLGVFTWAPFSVPFIEQKEHHGMLDKLVTNNGVPIIATQQYFEYLSIYCSQHLRGSLQELATQRFGDIKVSWRKCAQ